MTAEDYEKAARADSTLKAYASDIRYFGRDGCPMPSSPTDVIEWLVKASTTLAPATIQRRLVALSVWHKQRGFTSPVADSKVKRVFAGICRTLGTKQRSVKPLVRDDLISVLASVERQNPIAAARDSALLLLAFASALRRSNLVMIKVEELTRHSQGLDIFIPRSKTDPGKGRVLSVPNALGDHCPVKALTYWLTISGIKSGYPWRQLQTMLGTPRCPRLLRFRAATVTGITIYTGCRRRPTNGSFGHVVPPTIFGPEICPSNSKSPRATTLLRSLGD
jgi:hypothetical protein